MKDSRAWLHVYTRTTDGSYFDSPSRKLDEEGRKKTRISDNLAFAFCLQVC